MWSYGSITIAYLSQMFDADRKTQSNDVHYLLQIELQFRDINNWELNLLPPVERNAVYSLHCVTPKAKRLVHSYCVGSCSCV